MTTPRAALHVATEPSEGGGVSDLARNPDPLRRLEAELQRAGGATADGERLHAQAWELLEEAWGLVTECLVLRDGLLDACREIEQTMDGVQRRLGALPVSGEAGRGGQSQVGAPGGAVAP
jgi:hypothetical protein